MGSEKSKISKTDNQEPINEANESQQPNDSQQPNEIPNEKNEEINEIREKIIHFEKEVNQSLEDDSEEELRKHTETCKKLFDDIDTFQNLHKKKNLKNILHNLGKIDRQINLALANRLTKNKESACNDLNSIDQKILEKDQKNNSDSIIDNLTETVEEQVKHESAHMTKIFVLKVIKEQDKNKISQNQSVMNEIEENLNDIQKSISVFLGLPTDSKYLKLEKQIEDLLKNLKVINTNGDNEDLKERQKYLLEKAKITLQLLQQRSYDLEAIEKIENRINKFEKQIKESVKRLSDYEKEHIEEDLYHIEDELKRMNVIEELQTRRNICFEKIHNLYEALSTV